MISSEQKTTISRRELLVGAGATALGLGMAKLGLSAPPKPDDLRFVFMPCIHFRLDLESPQGLEAALKAVEKLDPRPQFIATGGDVLHNLRDDGVAFAQERFDLLKKIWSDNTNLPPYHALGNHEMVGWGAGNIPIENDNGGFRMPMRELGMDKLTYSFDSGGWHFVVLHNVLLTEPGRYIGHYSEQDLAWLRADLQANKNAPTVIVSHIRALTITEFVNGRAKKDDPAWSLTFDRMCNNPEQLIDTMREGNVKPVLSGHIHRLDDISVEGFRFVCSGATSGAQWRGPDHGTMPGFGIVDCRADRNLDYEYHDFGWKFD